MGREITDAELNNLSEQERLALQGDDAATLAAIAAKGDGATGEDTIPGGEDTAAGGGGDDTLAGASGDDTLAGAGGEDTLAGAAGDATTQDDDPAPFAPVYDAKLPEDFNERMDGLRTQEQELADKFSAGDITFDEYRKESKALSDQIMELNGLRTKAEISTEMSEQTARQRWAWEVDRFMKDTLKAEGLDYKGNPLLNVAFDAAVKTLANDPKNAHQSGEWFLEEAHKNLKAQLGLGKKPDEKKPDEKQLTEEERKQQAIDQRKRGIPEAPKTLSGVPAAAASDTGQDEFAQLDSLAETDVMAYEAALAKLPKDAQARYLGG